MQKSSVPLYVAVAFALGCAATAVFSVPRAHARAPERWEYFCLHPWTASPAKLAEKLSKAGAEGWELVGAAGATDIIWCMKRPAP